MLANRCAALFAALLLIAPMALAADPEPPASAAPAVPQAAAERILAAADQLRQLLLDSGYEPHSLVTNARMNDGEVLVFKGEDADKHTTILRLAAAAQPARRSGEKPATATTALALSYI